MSIQSHRESIESKGRQRKFMVSAPEMLLPGAMLLIALHGSTQRGSIMRRTSEFDRLLDDENLVVLYPDAVDGIWKDGRDDDGGVDDVAFIADLVEYAATEFGIDRDRAFLAGVSNGGFMTQRVMCHRPELFRAAAAVISNMGSDIANGCDPEQVRSMFLLAGTTDPVVPFAGGYVKRVDGSQYKGSILSFEDSVGHWRSKGMWTEQTGQQEVDLGNDMSALETNYVSPDHDEKLKVVVINGGGHHWFGKKMDESLQLTFGKSTLNYQTSKEIWAFFGSLD